MTPQSEVQNWSNHQLNFKAFLEYSDHTCENYVVVHELHSHRKARIPLRIRIGEDDSWGMTAAIWKACEEGRRVLKSQATNHGAIANISAGAAAYQVPYAVNDILGETRQRIRDMDMFIRQQNAEESYMRDLRMKGMPAPQRQVLTGHEYGAYTFPKKDYNPTLDGLRQEIEDWTRGVLEVA